MMIQRFPLHTLMILVFAFACSKQGEGERCGDRNGNSDCDDGLECAPPKSGLACDPNSAVLQPKCLPYICCPPRPQRSNVEACTQYQYGVTNPTTGGSSAGGGSGVDTGDIGGSSAGGSDTGIGGGDTGGNSSAGTEIPVDDAGV